VVRTPNIDAIAARGMVFDNIGGERRARTVELLADALGQADDTSRATPVTSQR
jgi:hypothetical protein